MCFETKLTEEVLLFYFITPFTQSKEWNQVVSIRAIKVKTFKEAAEVLGTSSTTVIRRFKEKQLVEGVSLPKAIAIDILPNRKKETIKIRAPQHLT